jgi:hypothetical protein
MARSTRPHLRRLIVGGVATAVVAGLWLRSHADPPPTAPPPAPASHELLQELSHETQDLYEQSCRSMVKVQLPTPQWLEQYNARQNLINKWGPELNPALREKILEDQEKALKELQHSPATLPSTQPFSIHIEVTDAPRPPEPGLALFAVGVLVDSDGHAVFPVYVDRKSIGDSSWQAVTGDGQLTTAKFVGSDIKTNLTVLQLENHSGTPAALGHHRPEDGSLTLSIARDGSAKLVVWNNQHPETGFAILPDGSMSGFGSNGYFLGASQAKPVVDQLIATGEVHRALLGVLTQEVGKEDPIRHQHPSLGNSPAIRIVQVREDSAASRGGIQPEDLILKIGDEPVGDAPTFAAVIASKSGQTVLHVLRGDKMIELTVNLEPQ